MKCSAGGLVTVLSSLLLARLQAITIQYNIDTEEPTVIRSPAAPGDGFGWTAVLHQQEVVSGSDDIRESLRKTR